MTVVGPYEDSYPPSLWWGSGADPTGVVAGTPGSFTPPGSAVPANIADLRALGLLDSGVDAGWTFGQYVLIQTGHVHWNGTDWATGNGPALQVMSAEMATGVVTGKPGHFTPAGAPEPANITELRALELDPGDYWDDGEWVAIGSGNVHWTGDDWAMGKAP